MAVPKHLEEAVGKLQDASSRIELARARPPGLESHHDWLLALTDFVMALAEVHEYTNESVHEKLHELAGRLGLKGPTSPPKLE